MRFETKWIPFFGAKLRCFLPSARSHAKAMWYADETVSFQGCTIGAMQRSNIFNKYQHWLYTHSVSSGFVSALLQKGNVAKFLFQ